MKIYCAGIGGIGLSAYAALQQANGHTVLGSDTASTVVTDALQATGISVAFVQDGTAIPHDIDVFVYSEAVPASSAERVRATALNVPQMSYFQALADISKDHFVIAVCGTHGKSSTTGMLAQVFTELGADPTVIVGTKLPYLQGKNWRKGNSGLCIVEACEYNRHFLHLRPNIIVLTNADGDHFDTYKDATEYEAAFIEFVRLLPVDGTIVTHGADEICARIAAHAPRSISVDSLPLPELTVPGVHMQQNAQLVMGVASVYRPWPTEDVVRVLRQYVGSWRRLENRGVTVHSVPVIDDYGHHPVEIAANIAALRTVYANKRLVLVFQPHTHRRTIDLYQAFTTCFAGVDVLYMPPIYEARKQHDTQMVNVQSFCQDIAAHSQVAVHSMESIQVIQKHLLTGGLQEGDVLVCMGAGDITTLATAMVAAT
jgi:UDP-N-acetylmuramate--alanine ligase